jgi:predicted RNA binding protein YcfA (HicA-like mRNA interferase family)
VSRRLPVVSGQDMIKALRKIGYERDHQTGSHIILRHTAPPHRRVSIPNHAEIARGTLRAIIRETGLTIDELGHLLE